MQSAQVKAIIDSNYSQKKIYIRCQLKVAISQLGELVVSRLCKEIGHLLWLMN